ncbi:hypothetical protein ES703_54273 [subsurface metagenome]
MVMQQPGDQIISGVLSGQVDAFQLAPAMPWESPLPFVPRYLARQLWPQGFKPFQLAAGGLTGTVQPAPPVAAKVIPQPAVQVAAPPVAAPMVTRSINSGGEPISARPQRVRIRERPGL